jgi:predicted ATP-dependent endonuclease of OLD family
MSNGDPADTPPLSGWGSERTESHGIAGPVERMRLHSCHVRNLRRLRDVHIDLGVTTTTFVGANNSGKTTAAQALMLFLNGPAGPKFSIHDFSNGVWEDFNRAAEGEPGAEPFPAISLDLWFEVDDQSLHRVFELLPDLDWSGSKVGIRISYEARDPLLLHANYRQMAAEATESQAESQPSGTREPRTDAGGDGRYRPWPRNMIDYLSRRLNAEYELRYYKLDDARFDPCGAPVSAEYSPARMDGSRVLSSLLKVDFVRAQRDLTDPDGSARSDNLSRRLSSFYQQNLEQHGPDHQALRALAESEHRLDEHFSRVFAETLDQIRRLGYPGIADPEIEIRSSLAGQSVLSSNAAIHYVLPGADAGRNRASLPEQYNGLGLKNLIYMIVEVLGFHRQWQAIKHDRPPVHLIMIEEPEAHLHAQIQQVFIRKVRDLVQADKVAETQLVITTHSSHVVFEDFEEIRYFRREPDESAGQTSTVRSLLTFANKEPDATTTFLQKYLRLTHCDLFFADAAVLVEGPSERLLLPLFIQKAAPDLDRCHLSVLEIGGAFAHKFRALVEFLAIPCLIITDLDSVAKKDGQGQASACPADTPGATTSNPMLRDWLPKMLEVGELLAATNGQKTSGQPANVRVAYQTREDVHHGGDTEKRAGRTFEEAFALRNLTWSQAEQQKHLGLHVDGRSLAEVAAEVYGRVRRDFDKTAFAMGLLSVDESTWSTPAYIEEGLMWLSSVLLPAVQAPVSTPGGD